MDLLLIAFQIIVVILSIVIHEVSHGFMAFYLGDPTAKNAGRLTLNPIRHIELFGSIILPLLTYFAGGFIFGYAKPVPYNPYLLRDQKYGPAKVAIAGPGSNLLIAVLFGIALRFLLGTSLAYTTSLPIFFAFIVLINLALAVFNLMPIPPLDGHWLLLTFLPARFNAFKAFIVRYGMFLFIIFLLFVFPYIFPVIRWLFKLIVGVSF